MDSRNNSNNNQNTQSNQSTSSNNNITNDQNLAIVESNRIRNGVIGPALIMRASNAAPETPALYKLWRSYYPPDLRMQRNEGYGTIDPKAVKEFYRTSYNQCVNNVDIDTAATANYYLKQLDSIRNKKGCYDSSVGNKINRFYAPYEVLSILGCENASKMHKVGEGIGNWSTQEWLDHYKEEEDYLFPVLLKISDNLYREESVKLKETVMNLVNDHSVFKRDYLSKGKAPPSFLSLVHGQKEDNLIKKYNSEIIRIIKG